MPQTLKDALSSSLNIRLRNNQDHDPIRLRSSRRDIRIGAATDYTSQIRAFEVPACGISCPDLDDGLVIDVVRN